MEQHSRQFYSIKTWFWMFIVAILIGIICALFGSSINSKYLTYSIFLIIVLAVIIFGIITSYKTHGYLDILSPYVFFPMMYLVIYGVGPHKALGINQEIGNLVLNVIAGGFCAFIIGALLMTSFLLKKGDRTKSIDNNINFLTGRRFNFISRLAFIVGLIALMMYFVNAKGIPILMNDLENSRVQALSGNGIPYYLSMLIMISIWVYYLSEKSLISKILLLLIGLILLLSTGWRNTAVALLLVCVLIYHYQRPIPFRKLVFTGIMLVLIITVTGLFRIYSSDLQAYELMKLMMEGKYLEAFFAYLYNYPVVFTENLILVLNGFNNSSTYLNGMSFIWNFGLIVPGVNIEAFDFYLKEYLHVGFAGGGLPPTLLGDFYLNFGYAGVFIGMTLMGALWKYLHYKFMTNKRNLVGLGALITLYYLSVSVRGGIENITLTTTWLLLALSILSILSKFKITR